MSIDFQVGGSTDLELRFNFTDGMEEAIRKDLEAKGRATPTFEYGYYLKDGTLATKITNTVAIRPRLVAAACPQPAPLGGPGGWGGLAW